MSSPLKKEERPIGTVAFSIQPRYLCCPETCLSFCVECPAYPEHNFTSYNDTIPLRKQILNADTVVREAGDHLQVGDNFFCCTTPKIIPTEVDPLQTNSLFGGIWGLVSDMDQIKTGFLYTLNILFEQGLETRIHAKCNLLLNQQAVGSLSPLLRRKQEEHLEATDALEHGVKFVRIIPILLVWDRDLEGARESCTRARRIWEDNGYVMQQDTFILKILFLSALPFGLYTTGRNIDNLERDFIAPVPSVTPSPPSRSLRRNSSQSLRSLPRWPTPTRIPTSATTPS